MEEVLQQELNEYQNFLSRMREQVVIPYAQRRLQQGVTDSPEEEWKAAIQEILRKEQETVSLVELSLEISNKCEKELLSARDEISELQYTLREKEDLARTSVIQNEQIQLYQEQIKILNEDYQRALETVEEQSLEIRRLHALNQQQEEMNMQIQLQSMQRSSFENNSIRKNSRDVKVSVEMRALQEKINLLSRELEENKQKLDEEKQMQLNLHQNYLKVQEKMHELQSKHSRVSSQNEQLITALAAAQKLQQNQQQQEAEAIQSRNNLQDLDSFVVNAFDPQIRQSQVFNQSFNAANRFSSVYGNILDVVNHKVTEDGLKIQGDDARDSFNQNDSENSSVKDHDNNLIFSSYLQHQQHLNHQHQHNNNNNNQLHGTSARAHAKADANGQHLYSPESNADDHLHPAIIIEEYNDDLGGALRDGFDDKKTPNKADAHVPNIKTDFEEMHTEKMRQKYRQNSARQNSMFIRKIQNYENKSTAKQSNQQQMFQSLVSFHNHPQKQPLQQQNKQTNFLEIPNHDYMSMVSTASLMEASATTNPYEIFFILTSQCVKLNSQHFIELATLNTRPIYDKIKEKNIPIHQWAKFIEGELESMRVKADKSKSSKRSGPLIVRFGK